MFARTLTAAALVAVTAVAADAAPVLGEGETTGTTGVFGITIPLGSGQQPKLSIGLRRMTVTSSGDVQGGEVRLTFDPRDLRDLQLRLLALRGTVDHQGALGGGWDFGAGRPFASGGVLLPHVFGVVDFGLDGLQPQLNIGLDSAGRPDVPPYVPLFFPCGAPAGPGSITTAC